MIDLRPTAIFIRVYHFVIVSSEYLLHAFQKLVQPQVGCGAE